MYRTLLTLILIATVFSGFAQNIPKTSLEKDIKQLARILDETHPDPFSAYGNRIEFYRKVNHLIKGLPEDGMDTLSFFQYLAPLLSKLEDGHTNLKLPKSKLYKLKGYRLPVRFKVADDCIFVSETTDDYKFLIGQQLTRINGESLESFTNRLKALRPLENRFHENLTIASYLQQYARIKSYLNDIQYKLTLEFKDVQGNVKSYNMQYFDPKDQEINWVKKDEKEIHEDEKMIAWKFADPKQKIAYLQIDMMATREAFEQFPVESPIFQAYAGHWCKKLGMELSDPKQDILKKVPSLTEMSYDILQQMKKNNSTHLIIDLRKNGGGNTDCYKPLLYMMYGDAAFQDTVTREIVTKVSKLLLNRSKITIEEYNKRNESNYEYGDLKFWSSRKSPEEQEEEARKDKEAYFKRLEKAQTSTYDIVSGTKGEPVYTPKIVLLVSPNTFSAAYSMLYKFLPYGATAVGVTPGQAGNTYMDGIRFTLPESGLIGVVSKCKQVYFPFDPAKGKELTPNHVMKWSDFKKYDFDANAEFLYVLDLIKSGSL